MEQDVNLIKTLSGGWGGEEERDFEYKNRNLFLLSDDEDREWTSLDHGPDSKLPDSFSRESM